MFSRTLLFIKEKFSEGWPPLENKEVCVECDIAFRLTCIALCSFGMAYDFIDSIGNDVDVVSDSEVCIIWSSVIQSSVFYDLIIKYCHGFCHLRIQWGKVKVCWNTSQNLDDSEEEKEIHVHLPVFILDSFLLISLSKLQC